MLGSFGGNGGNGVFSSYNVFLFTKKALKSGNYFLIRFAAPGNRQFLLFNFVFRGTSGHFLNLLHSSPSPDIDWALVIACPRKGGNKKTRGVLVPLGPTTNPLNVMSKMGLLKVPFSLLLSP